MSGAVAPGTPGATALYRYWDADEVLLYIGITGDLSKRETTHIRSSEWMQLAARSAVERYPTRKEARRVELAAIEDERPIFNVEGNDTAEARRRVRVYLEDHDLADLMGPWRRKGPSYLRVAPEPAEVTDPEEEEGCWCGREHGESEIWINTDGRECIPILFDVITSYEGEVMHVQQYLHSGHLRDLAAALIRHADADDARRAMRTELSQERRNWREATG